MTYVQWNTACVNSDQRLFKTYVSMVECDLLVKFKYNCSSSTNLHPQEVNSQKGPPTILIFEAVKRKHIIEIGASLRFK